MLIRDFITNNLNDILISIVSGAVIALLKGILAESKKSNKLLANHDNRITVCENTLDKIPCVQAGFNCHKEE